MAKAQENAAAADDFDAGFKKPESNVWKPGKIGDKFKGVYLGYKEQKSNYNDGMTRIHEFIGIAGDFHNIVRDEATSQDVVDATPTMIKKGDKYAIFGKGMLDQDLESAKIGMQVVVRFTGMEKSKKNGKMYKMIVGKCGGMDPDYVKEHGDASADQAF